jgi:integrase
MASIYRDKARTGWRAQVVVRGVLRKLWIGPATATGAKQIVAHLDALKAAAESATPAPQDSIRWAKATAPRIQAQLSKWGLIELGTGGDLPRSVVAFAQHYSAQVGAAASTKKRWKNVVQKMETHFKSASLAGVSQGDCDRISRELRQKYKSSHAGKLLGDFKQVFESAKRSNLIYSNPFDGIDTTAKHDKAREAYVDREIVLKLIENADDYYAAIIALARFAGLRVPSEPLALLWDHIDWDLDRITIQSPKTGHRIAPLFPEVKTPLRKLWAAAAEGSTLVFTRSRQSAATVWRAKLESILLASSIKPWPKLWQNLRASCRTDLESRVPGFVCNAWLGHSSTVAAKHYSRITDEHYRLAVSPIGLSPATPAQDQAEPVG